MLGVGDVACGVSVGAVVGVGGIGVGVSVAVGAAVAGKTCGTVAVMAGVVGVPPVGGVEQAANRMAANKMTTNTQVKNFNFISAKLYNEIRMIENNAP